MSTNPHHFPVPSSDLPPEPHGDLAFVLEITHGSTDAWQRFILRYSAFLKTRIEKYISDPEDVQTVYVSVLESLYRGKLLTYQGKASLASWLILVARSHTIDFLRRQFGRRDVPPGILGLSESDQAIFRLYFVKGQSVAEVRGVLGNAREPMSIDAFMDALVRIDEHLDDRTLQRIAYDLHAQSVGAASGRLLEFLEHMRLEAGATHRDLQPDSQLMRSDVERQVQRIKQMIDRLPAQEAWALRLRFERGLTANSIAHEMGLNGPRRAYTLISKGLRQIRRWMDRR